MGLANFVVFAASTELDHDKQAELWISECIAIYKCFGSFRILRSRPFSSSFHGFTTHGQTLKTNMGVVLIATVTFPGPGGHERLRLQAKAGDLGSAGE